ncbi:hypothetical protein [Neisseria animaloris]|uniref:BstA-like C-terminal domain-containing protein n=1 Tax=Neisseria animaloris TaxID=326522 RepID=A0A3S4Y8Q3_9NEIS|nr:hypothetical protein [Neisseria animaloris]VEJ21762.1 Uncharacterised protein [Neisseria animaloris]
MSSQNINYPVQGVLDLGIEVQRDVNGIEMGILENGIPYLTQNGLAKFAGVARSVIYDIANEWEAKFSETILGSDRNSILKSSLFQKGYKEPKLYIETKKDGQINYSYPDVVCMAILEYYTFDSKNKNETASNNYRALAAYGLQNFIYNSLNYKPLDKWVYYNDRVSLLQNRVPDGYFIVFKEITGLIVDLINANLTVNHKTVPDISVGKIWAKYWKDNNLDKKYGARIPCKHNYPSYYPQASSNPQDIHAYPDMALAEFRDWFKNQYLPTKFPAYILNKANLLPGGKIEANLIASMYNTNQITRSQ